MSGEHLHSACGGERPGGTGVWSYSHQSMFVPPHPGPPGNGNFQLALVQHHFLQIDMISFGSLTRFLVVGGTATAIHYALTAVFVWLGVLAPTPASGIAFLISAGLNYLASARFTFRGKHRHAQAFPRFVITAGAGCLINVTVLHLLVSFGLSFVVSQLVATALVLVWNYLINALWTFRRPSP